MLNKCFTILFMWHTSFLQILFTWLLFFFISNSILIILMRVLFTFNFTELLPSVRAVDEPLFQVENLYHIHSQDCITSVFTCKSMLMIFFFFRIPFYLWSDILLQKRTSLPLNHYFSCSISKIFFGFIRATVWIWTLRRTMGDRSSTMDRDSCSLKRWYFKRSPTSRLHQPMTSCEAQGWPYSGKYSSTWNISN